MPSALSGYLLLVGGTAPVGLDPSWMQFTVQTDETGATNSDQFQLVLSNYTTDFTVDWGDDTTDDITSYNQSELTHTYAAGAGEYTITLKPSEGEDKVIFGGLYYISNADRAKLKNIRQWGTAEWKSLLYAFYDCANLTCTATDIMDLSNRSNNNYQQAFRGCELLTTLGDTQSMNFTGVTNTLGMFLNAYAFNADFDQCDWSDITNASQMFNGAHLFNGSTPADMSSCQNFSYMHNNNWCLNDSTIESRDVSAGTNFHSCFRDCWSLDASFAGWDISNATTMTDFMSQGSLSRDNYDATIVAWDALTLAATHTFVFTFAQSSSAGAAATAKASLISGGHSFTDDGTYDRATGGAAVADMPSVIDIIVGTGQSNAHGSSGVTGSSNSPNPATTVGAEYRSDNGLVACDDPTGVTEGSFDAANTGSMYPSFVASYASETSRYPVILNKGVPATTALQWLNVGTNSGGFTNQCHQDYLAMRTAIEDAGKTVGRTILLYNQGEADAGTIDGGADADTIVDGWKEAVDMMYNVWNARCGGGLKLGVIQTGYECDTTAHTTLKTAAHEAIQDGQAEFCDAKSYATMASTYQPTTCANDEMSDPFHHDQGALNQVGTDAGVAMAAAF